MPLRRWSCQGLFRVVEFGEHPAPDRTGSAVRFRSRRPPNMGRVSEIDESLDRLIGCLFVVEHDADLMVLEVILKCRDVTRARLGIVHDRELEALVAHLQARVRLPYSRTPVRSR